MKATYIVLEPVTPKGTYTICRLTPGGKYVHLCSCRNESSSEVVLQALNTTLYTRGEKMYKAD